MSQLIFWTLLATSCIYAYWRGRWDERLAATVCLVATIATITLPAPSQVENRELLIDLIMLAVFVLMALRSMRFWPLWVAGLQLTITTSHVMKAIEGNLIPQVYAMAERIWSYPILVILIVATWRGTRMPGASQGLPS